VLKRNGVGCWPVIAPSAEVGRGVGATIESAEEFRASVEFFADPALALRCASEGYGEKVTVAMGLLTLRYDTVASTGGSEHDTRVLHWAWSLIRNVQCCRRALGVPPKS
jgi:hypothetical protein